jgi:hypothetical protein
MEGETMLRYLFLFLHVTSAMGVFAALGIEAAALVQLRRADAPTDVRAALRAYGLARPVGGLSLAGILLSGIYLATTAWQWRGAWIGLGFLGLLLTAGIGGVATGRRVPRLLAAATGSGGGAPRHDPVLWASFQARVAILIGVVYLMTVKPATRGSLVAMAVAIAAAVVASIASLRGRAQPMTSEPGATP